MLDNFFHLTNREDEVQAIIEERYLNHYKAKYKKEGRESPKNIGDLPKLDLEKVRKQIKEAISEKKKKQSFSGREVIRKIFYGTIYKENI